MRLLIVEDNAQLARLLAKGLRNAGYETDLLATASEARAALLTTTYAALILDLSLPDGDGLGILRELRHRKDPIPVLVLTARGGLHDRVGGLRSGADDYLVKPFALEELGRGWKPNCAGRVSSLEARSSSPIWYSICETGRPPSMISPRSCRPARRPY
jgi:DNA-binding response OmpR family regulator